MKLQARFARWLVRAAQLPLPPYQSQGGFLLQLGLNNLDLRPIAEKKDQLDSYVGWVYACVSTIAQDLRTNPWGIWQKQGERREDWELIDESKLPQVFKQPNTIDRTWGQLIERRNLHKDTTGEAYWHLITTRPGGRVLGIEMIQPDHVTEPILADNGNSIVAWKIEVPGRSPDTIDARDLITDFYPNPKDPLRGASPIEAFALAHHMDLYLRAYSVKLVRDGATVAQYVKTDQELTPEQAAAIEEQMNRKYRTPGRLAVMGKNTGIETPGLPMKDLELLDSLKPSREQILAIYKMPASKLGIVEDANRANMTAASKNYGENSLLPRLKTFDEIVNSILPRVFDKADNLAYESESPVEEDRAVIFGEALKELQAGAIKVNEFHRRIGNEDLGDEGEVFLIPATVKPVRSLIDAASPSPKSEPSSSPAPAEAADSLDDAARAIAEAAMPLLETGTTRELATLRRELSEERWLRAQENLEAKAKSKIRAQFTRDLKEMRKRLEEHFGQRSVMPHDKRDWIDDVQAAGVDDWKVLIESILKDSIEAGWDLFKTEVAGGIAFDLFEQNAVEYARRLAAQQIAEIDNTTVTAVRELVAQGIESGWSIPEMSRKLSELYDGFKGVRAETIARTETASAMGWGKYQAAKETASRLGMTLQREWLAVRDARTRPSHVAANGQKIIGMDATYHVGGFVARHPGDPSLPASELINCRCTEIYRDVSN